MLFLFTLHGYEKRKLTPVSVDGFHNIYRRGRRGRALEEGRLILISAREKLIDAFFHRVSLWFYKALDGSVYGIALFESR